MEIPKTQFKTISVNNSNCRNKVPSATIYFNGIYLSKSVVSEIAGKYEYARVSVAENVIAIELSKNQRDGFFRIKFSSRKSNQETFDSCLIGAENLSRIVSNELNLSVDRNRYYKSIDYKIDGNIYYFEFDKRVCNFKRPRK